MDHNHKMAHLVTEDGMACPQNCPYDGPDRLERRDYAPAIGKAPAKRLRSAQAVETKEGGSAGHIGNREFNPFDVGSEDDDIEGVPHTSVNRHFPPFMETKDIETDDTGHYPAAPNCIFASPVIDADGECSQCPPKQHFNMGEEIQTEYIEKAVQSGLRQRPGDQPLPNANYEEFCHTSLRRRMDVDLQSRLELGISRYGQGLQPFNGRDFGRDAYEEYLDLGVYLEGLRRERERMILVLKAVVAADYGTRENRHTVAEEAGRLLRSIGELGEETDASSATDEGRTA